MRAKRGDGGFRGHAGVADAMAAAHFADTEAGRDVAGQAHVLEDFDAGARAHDPQASRFQEGNGSGVLFCRDPQHGVVFDDTHGNGRA